MGRLSNISGREAVKMFEKFGYILDHQTGSHMILWHESKPTLSIPNHRELAPRQLSDKTCLGRGAGFGDWFPLRSSVV
jgi:predicted RNA binding protein YcfA (HicA-like mRNA interferase family)